MATEFIARARLSRTCVRMFSNLPSRQVPALSFVLFAIACANAGTSPPADAGSSDALAGGSSGSGGGSGSSGGSGSNSGSSSGTNMSSGGSGGGSGSSGGSGGSSGNADSGGSSSGVIAGGGVDGGCGSKTPAIHDDFENGLSAWQITDPFGNPIPPGSSQYSVTVDTVHAHGPAGTHAVKVHNGGLFGTAPPASAFYGRAWVWLGSSPGDVPSGGHWGWILGVGPGDAGPAVEVRMGGQFGILIDNYSPNDDVVLSDPSFFNDGMDGGTRTIAGQWTCVEFYFGKDALRTWINGSEVASLNVTPATTWSHGMKAPWSPTYAAVRLGYANYNANPIDVWYDDVAIDTNRVCCP
ncbi:MAG: hypothetical protein M3O46_10950 [Myxococcota bacterium]|nr:hypothetical protein [Myxococcota bacterium]